MSDAAEDDDHGGSKVCFLDEVVGGHVVDPETRRDVARFRKGERARLYALRREMPVEIARAAAKRVAEGLNALLPDVAGKVIAGYWPIRGELDLRFWLEAAAARGAALALPVVVAKGQPVEFHAWTPGAKMTRGIWDIPVPADGVAVRPDVVLVPLLGVDEAGYRLGNGGGYYDMTLAGFTPKPLTIGVGQSFCRMKTIFPLAWDIPMDKVVLG